MDKHFVLAFSFPDPAAMLARKYHSLAESKKDGWVALDANVLLAPYKLDAGSLDKITAVYDHLAGSKRLIVPAQALREFTKNRSKNLADLAQTVQDNSSVGKAPPSRQIEYLKNDKSYQKALVLAQEVDEKLREYRKSIASVVSTIADWTSGSDPVVAAYAGSVSSSVRELSLSEDERKLFKAEMQFRFEMKLPPGFKDGSKPDDGAGDLIIWKTILLAARDSKRDMLFVSNEEKGDWFVRGGGLLQPRPELIEEYYRVSNGGTLHILSLSAFLKLFEVDETVVSATAIAAQETRDEEERATQSISLAEDLSVAERLVEVEAEIARMVEAMRSLPQDYNDSLSLPWNKAAHSLRYRLRALEDQAKLLRTKIELGSG